MTARDGVLLIGGGGFIGSALARQLADEGYTVHVVTRRSPHVVQRDHLHIHEGGQDPAELAPRLLQECGMVIHLASTTTPGATANHPTREAEENILPALRLIEAMQTRPPARLIFISSGGTLYGDPESLPANETLALHPRSYHGAGKAALEHFFGVFAEQTGISYAVLRPSNVYGPGQPLRGGFGLVRHLFECVLTRQPLEVWGDGETSRDFLYIDDMVSACSSLIKSADQQGIFNAGTGIATTINQLRALVEDIAQSEMPIRYSPSRGIDVRAITLDSRRLANAIGWQARVALPEGLRRTWAWLQST